MSIKELLMSNDTKNIRLALDILGIRKQKYEEMWISVYNGQYKIFKYLYKEGLVAVAAWMPPNSQGGFFTRPSSIGKYYFHMDLYSYERCLRLYNKREKPEEGNTSSL